MRHLTVAAILVSLLSFCSFAYAQSPAPTGTQSDPAEWVRISRTAPDFTNTEKGWEDTKIEQLVTRSVAIPEGQNQNEAVLVLTLVTRVYVNETDRLWVRLIAYEHENGEREEIGIYYGDFDNTVMRFAITVDGKRFVAAGLYSPNENGITLTEPVTKDNDPISVKISLDTVEGVKSRILYR
ncbi:MAG: hypothetical protein HY434_01260 [Candidatus Liptonbacteria bacterium]|nr:hypothetical protein [Candidatus Liptonbacteria bacterium]